MIFRLGTEAAGLGIVLFAIREVFSDIFHPTRSGNLSDLIGKTTSHLFRKTVIRPSAGPIALIAVILSWVILLAVGFALIYSGLYPAHFTSHTGELSTGLSNRFVHCLYFSLGALSTFQTFDLDPQTPWLKLIVAIEGLIGIGMITASVSWLVLLYPALERIRQLSLRVSLLVKAEKQTGLSLIDHLGVSTFTDLSQAMIRLRLDLILFPILLHFHATEGSAAIGPSLPQALRLCREGMSSSQPYEVRRAATQLQIALEDLSQSIAERVLLSKETDILQVFSERYVNSSSRQFRPIPLGPSTARARHWARTESIGSGQSSVTGDFGCSFATAAKRRQSCMPGSMTRRSSVPTGLKQTRMPSFARCLIVGTLPTPGRRFWKKRVRQALESASSQRDPIILKRIRPNRAGHDPWHRT